MASTRRQWWYLALAAALRDLGPGPRDPLRTAPVAPTTPGAGPTLTSPAPSGFQQIQPAPGVQGPIMTSPAPGPTLQTAPALQGPAGPSMASPPAQTIQTPPTIQQTPILQQTLMTKPMAPITAPMQR